MMGEHAVEGFLEVLPRNVMKEEPHDQMLQLVLPGGETMVPRNTRATKAAGVGDLTEYDPFKNHSAYQADLARPHKDPVEEAKAAMSNDPTEKPFEMLDGTVEMAVNKPTRVDDKTFPKFNEVVPPPVNTAEDPNRGAVPTYDQETLTEMADGPPGREYLDQAAIEQAGAGALEALTSKAAAQPIEKQADKSSKKKNNR
jgi:hypothetical protein